MANEGALSAADGPEERGRGGAGHESTPDRVQKTPFGAEAADDPDGISVDGPVVDSAIPFRKPPTRRLNLNLPETLYQDLAELAVSQGKSMTEIVRTGLGLAYIAYAETGKRHKLMVTDAEGRPVREIVIPR